MIAIDDTDLDLTHLKNYKIIELLAQGGMGKVYLAEDTRLNRTVAIKKLKIHHSENTTDIALKEAQILAQLNHPNIVQIFDIIQESNQMLLVMEYINGKTLQQIIKEDLPSLSQKLNWLYQILKGLIVAHEKGIVHCDLKPSNIIIGKNNEAKITDFGIAHLEIEEDSYNTSYASQFFMSPEQSNGDKIDFKSDLFSFGVLAYILISGEHPFQSKTKPFLQEISAFDLIPRIPEELATLIDQLLKPNKNERPDSAKVVAYKIKQLLIMISQQEMLEQETISLSNMDTQPIANSPTRSKADNKKFSPLKWLVFIVIVAIGVVYNSSQELVPQPEISQLVVLRPTISGNSKISDLRKYLVIAALDNAIREMVINAKSMRLISREEVEALPQNVKDITKATGATDVISTLIDCNNLQCSVTMSRLRGHTWSVHAQKQWPIPFKNFNEIHSTAQLNFSLLHPESKDVFLKDFKSSGSDFDEYIHLYSKLRVNDYNSKDAISELESLIERSPYLYSAYNLFREVSLDQYAETRNIKYLEKLEKTLSASPDEYKKSIFYYIDNFWLLVNLKDFHSAEQMIAGVVSLGADNSTINELKAKLFLEQNKIELAIKSYKKALILRPSTTLLYNLSLCYLWIGDITESKRTAQKLLTILPNDYLARQLLASLSMFQGDLVSAIQIYSEIIQENPKSIDLNNLAITYSLDGKNDYALKLAEKAVAQSPDNPTWILNLADIELFLELRERSRKNYQKVIALNTNRDDLKSWLEIAQAYIHLGENELSIRALDSAKKISADNSEVTFTAALIYTLIGEETSAIINVEEALKNNVGVVWFNLPWFDKLCNNKKFIFIISNAGNASRCNTKT